jgi:hypothetical protein
MQDNAVPDILQERAYGEGESTGQDKDRAAEGLRKHTMSARNILRVADHRQVRLASMPPALTGYASTVQSR